MSGEGYPKQVSARRRELTGAADRGASLSGEKLAYWFFRLNGCFTIENFVVHPDFGGDGQRTDADLLGVRFPHRQEGLVDPMADHPSLMSDRLLLFIAEVKLRTCALNGPWTRPQARNLVRVLGAAGLHPPAELESVADRIYSDRFYRDEHAEVRFYAIGDEPSPRLDRHPDVRQLLWNDVLDFVHQRFTRYNVVKRDHNQWDPVGRRLFAEAGRRDRESFVQWGRSHLTDPNNRRLE
jgi:hypothetical protein